MKIVLLKDLKGKGKKGEIIEVNSSYAQNYLIPNGYAILGTNTNVNQAKQAQASKNFKDEQELIKAQELAKKLENVSIVINVKCGENGKMFGSISNKEISDELNNATGLLIDRKKIESVNLKSLGSTGITIKLHPQVKCKITVSLVNKK